MGLDGRGLRKLTDGLRVRSVPGWSPDGRRLTVSAEARGTFEIYVLDVDGAAPPRRLTTGADGLREE